MNIGKIFRIGEAEGPVVDPSDHRLVSGTPESMRQAMRELRRNQAKAAIVQMKTEIPRAELEFGRRWIEHVASPSGDRYKVFGGVADYSEGIEFFYFTAEGEPLMLERIGSRREEEEYRAALEQRNDAKEAERRERWARLKETAGR
jgi:hypothetical protein